MDKVNYGFYGSKPVIAGYAICPPVTNFAVYNHLKGKKNYLAFILKYGIVMEKSCFTQWFSIGYENILD